MKNVRKVKFTIPIGRVVKRRATYIGDAAGLLLTAAANCRNMPARRTLDLVRGAQNCLIRADELEQILKGEV